MLAVFFFFLARFQEIVSPPPRISETPNCLFNYPRLPPPPLPFPPPVLRHLLPPPHCRFSPPAPPSSPPNCRKLTAVFSSFPLPRAASFFCVNTFLTERPKSVMYLMSRIPLLLLFFLELPLSSIYPPTPPPRSHECRTPPILCCSCGFVLFSESDRLIFPPPYFLRDRIVCDSMPSTYRSLPVFHDVGF